MLPYPLENETSASYCSRLARLNHGKGYVRANIYRSMKVDPSRPVFGGFDQLNQFLSEHDIDVDTYSRTSILPFFKPFTPPALYTTIRDHALRYAESVGHLMPRTFLRCFADKPKFCLTCVEADFDRYGFSYLRRQHQIICNAICEKHHEKLLSACPSCAAPLVEDGIPLLHCASCGAPPRNAELTEFRSSEQFIAFRRIAEAITCIFAGEIVGNIKLNSLLNSAGAEILPEEVIGARVAENILKRCGPAYLSDQRMHPGRKPHFGWPAIYLSGSGGGSNPVMELLLYGTDKLCRSEEELWGSVAGSYQRRGCHSHSAIDLGVLKAVFRYMTVMEASEDQNLEYSTLNTFVATYPLLNEKLDRMRTRRLIAKHRESIIMQLSSQPSATLKDFKLHNVAAYRFLRRNDMEWWMATARSAKDTSKSAQGGHRKELDLVDDSSDYPA